MIALASEPSVPGKVGYRLDGSPPLDGSRASLSTTAPEFDRARRPLAVAELLAINRRFAKAERRFRAVIDALPQMIGIVDAGATLLYANERWYAFTGARVVSGCRLRVKRLVHPADEEGARAIVTASKTTSDVWSDIRLRRADGSFRWQHVRIVRLDDGAEAQWLFTCTDAQDERAIAATLHNVNAQLVASAISDRATAAELREKNRLMTMAAETAHVGYWRLNLISNELFWSDEVFRTYGLPSTQQPTLETAIAMYHPDDRKRVNDVVARAISAGTPFRYESRIVQPDGAVRYVAANGQSDCAADGSVFAIFGVFQDVTDAKNAESERERLRLRVSVATKVAQIGIWDWDLSTNTILWDAIMFGLYGFADAEFSPTYEKWTTLIHADDRARATAELAVAAAGGAAFDTEFRIVWPDGDVRNIRALATLVRAAGGQLERVIGTNTDITEIRTLADQLQKEKDAATFSAGHDALTGLVNRRGLETWIKARPNMYATLLYLDIDGFKAVNDRGGHAAGDDALRLVARIIREAVRDDDCCARLGGDEFLIVLLDVDDSATTARIIERITTLVEGLRPLGSADETRIGISTGIGRVTGGHSTVEAMRDADTDLYRHKSERKAALREHPQAAGRPGMAKPNV